MAFTLPRVPRVRLPKGRHRRVPGAHRDAPGRPHPVVPAGGSSRRTNQRAAEEVRHRGEHRAGGGVHRGPREHRARDPFLPAERPVERPAARGTRGRPTPVMGQPGPGSGPGNPRSRFGPMPHVRVTDLAPAYRKAGTPARTPREQRDAELSQAALIRATKAAQAERRARTGRAAAEHEPGRATTRPTRTGGTTYRSQHATKTTATAKRPPSPLPGSPEDLAARQAAARKARKGSSGQDPRPQAAHPFFSGGNRAAPPAKDWRSNPVRFGDAT